MHLYVDILTPAFPQIKLYQNIDFRLMLAFLKEPLKNLKILMRQKC